MTIGYMNPDRFRRWFYRTSPTATVLGAILIVTVVLGFAAASGDLGIPIAIVAAAISVSASVAGQFISINQQNKREIAVKFREQRADVYARFIKIWMDQIMAGKLQQGKNQPSTQKFLSRRSRSRLCLRRTRQR